MCHLHLQAGLKVCDRVLTPLECVTWLPVMSCLQSLVQFQIGWNSLTLDDLEGQYCNENCISCSASVFFSDSWAFLSNMIYTVWCHFMWHSCIHWPWKCGVRHENCDSTWFESKDILNNRFLRNDRFWKSRWPLCRFCESGSYQKWTGHEINNTRKKLMLLSGTSTSIPNLVLSCPTVSSPSSTVTILEFTRWSKHEANVFKIHVHDVCFKSASCLPHRVNRVHVLVYIIAIGLRSSV